MIAWLRQHRCGALLAILCLLILADPIARGLAGLGSFVLTILLLVALGLTAWSLGVRRSVLVVLGLLGLLAMGVIFEPPGSSHWRWVVAVASLTVFTAIVTVCLLQYVLDVGPITTDKVFGAVDAYVLIGFTFASLFAFLELVQPNAFHATVPGTDGVLSWVELMYFSFTVLTSTGFGEITPATSMARSLIVIEQIVGVMYVAFLIARLANLYGRDGQR
jgi:ion channel